MADRGTFVAIQDAQQYYGEYAHLLDPVGVHAEADAEYVPDPQQPATNEADFVHIFDGPLGPTAWGDQFEAPRLGDGFYMTPPNTTDKRLVGAPNGAASTSGELVVDLALAGTPVGSSTAAPAPLLREFAFSATPAGSSTLSAAFLRRLVDFSATPAGSSAVAARGFGILGAYRAAVLASAPQIFLHLDESSGNNFLNDAALGGGNAATIGNSPNNVFTRFPNHSLLQTAVGDIRLSNSTTTDARVTVNAGVGTVGLGHTTEFFLQATSGQERNLFNFAGTSGVTSGVTLLSISVLAGGQIQVQRGSPTGLTGPGAFQFTGSTVITDNKPHHIVATYDPAGNGTGYLYVDGVLDGSGTAAVPRATDNNDPTFINPPQWRGYTWYVDELTWYDRTLAPSEVAAHYDAAWFDIRLRGASAGVATSAADLIFVGGEFYELEGSALGLATVTGEFYDGVVHEFEGALAGTAVVDSSMRQMRLNLHQIVTTPRARARFVRAKF